MTISSFAPIVLAFVLCLVPLGCSNALADKPVAGETTKGSDTTKGSGFYALSSTDIDGKPQALSQYVGKVALVVNTASQCGYTPQYEGLQKLYAELAPRGFVVLGYPSNDFGGQEPGTPAEIKTFCSSKFHVTFPMFSKVVTKAGAEQSPIYANLAKATGSLPNWNFCKYLIGKDGKVLAFFPSKVAPNDAELKKAIEAALAQK